MAAVQFSPKFATHVHIIRNPKKVLTQSSPPHLNLWLLLELRQAESLTNGDSLIKNEQTGASDTR